MKTLHTYRLPILLFMVVLFVNAQITAWKQIDKKKGIQEVQKLSNYLDNPCFEMTIVHQAYYNTTSIKPDETYTGFYKKNGRNSHSLLLGKRTIQYNGTNVTIDSLNKIIIVSTVLEDKTIANVTKPDEALITEMYTQQLAGDNWYKALLNENSMYEAIEFKSDKSNRMVESILHYRYEVTGEDDKKYKPRISILFKNHKVLKTISETEFSFDNYITPIGKLYKVTSAYKNFKLYDNRIKK